MGCALHGEILSTVSDITSALDRLLDLCPWMGREASVNLDLFDTEGDGNQEWVASVSYPTYDGAGELLEYLAPLDGADASSDEVAIGQATEALEAALRRLVLFYPQEVEGVLVRGASPERVLEGLGLVVKA